MYIASFSPDNLLSVGPEQRWNRHIKLNLKNERRKFQNLENEFRSFQKVFHLKIKNILFEIIL
jgi:hypothetical protein